MQRLPASLVDDPLPRILARLVSSILIWMDSYFIVRYGPGAETIAPQTLWGAVIIGLLYATFLAFYIPLVKGWAMRARVGK